jgi:hypothetical protein
MYRLEGGDIVERLGRSFGFLPVPTRFVCKYHRRLLTSQEVEQRSREMYLAGLSPEARASTPATMGPPPMAFLDCENQWYWPEGVPLDVTRSAEFPQPSLPDGRWIVCIPIDPDLRPPTARQVHWKAVVLAAKRARGAILQHAYDVAREQLSTWKATGPETIRLLREREAITKLGKPIDPDSYPFNVPIEWELSSWVNSWANPLWQEPSKAFTPSIEALAMLQGVVGVQPETIKTWMARAKRVERGIPAEGWRKNGVRTRKVQRKRVAPE